VTPKITTEIFILRAREKHGEFWQKPSIHLMGCGCTQCSTTQNAERLRLWTREKCFIEAKKYFNRGDFKKGQPGAYTKSRVKGWLDEFLPK